MKNLKMLPISLTDKHKMFHKSESEKIIFNFNNNTDNLTNKMQKNKQIF